MPWNIELQFQRFKISICYSHILVSFQKMLCTESSPNHFLKSVNLGTEWRLRCTSGHLGVDGSAVLVQKLLSKCRHKKTNALANLYLLLFQNINHKSIIIGYAVKKKLNGVIPQYRSTAPSTATAHLSNENLLSFDCPAVQFLRRFYSSPTRPLSKERVRS